mgnify:CR=1 FL=1
MVKQYKVDEVSDLRAKLENYGNFILTDYSGIKVKDLGLLRSKLREKEAIYKVVKNNLFIRALKETGNEAICEKIKGPVAVAFAGEQVGEVAKVLKEFKAEVENFSYFSGMLDSTVYDENEIAKIADLPSKEVLLAKVMSLVNGPSTQIAMGMNQVMSSLARGIQAVAEKNNQS